MAECKCCPYGYHIYLDFVQYCEKLGKNSPTHEQRQRQKNRRQRKSKVLMLGFDELEQLSNIAFTTSLENLNTSAFVTCYPHEKNEFVKDIVKDMCHDFDQVLNTKVVKQIQNVTTNNGGGAAADYNLRKRSINPFEQIPEIRAKILAQKVVDAKLKNLTNWTLNKKVENITKKLSNENLVDDKNYSNEKCLNKFNPSSGASVVYQTIEEESPQQLKKSNQSISNRIQNNIFHKMEENILLANRTKVTKVQKLTLSKFDSAHPEIRIERNRKNNEQIIVQDQDQKSNKFEKQTVEKQSTGTNPIPELIELNNEQWIKEQIRLNRDRLIKELNILVDKDENKTIVPQQPAIVQKNYTNMGTMTTTVILRDIGITTAETSKRSIETQSDLQANASLQSVKTQTQKTDVRTVESQTATTPAKTLINRSTSTATDSSHFLCSQCSTSDAQRYGSISLKNLDNFANKSYLKSDTIRSTISISTQSTIDSATKSIQCSCDQMTRGTNTDSPLPQQQQQQKDLTPEKRIIKLSKFTETDPIRKVDQGTTAERPRTVDRGTVPNRIEQKTVGCGDMIRPHIQISCADNYCDSCKDTVKSLARNFLNLQDSGVVTDDNYFTSESPLSSTTYVNEEQFNFHVGSHYNADQIQQNHVPTGMVHRNVNEIELFDDDDEENGVDIVELFPVRDEPFESTLSDIIEESYPRLIPSEDMLNALNTMNKLLIEPNSQDSTNRNSDLIAQCQWFEVSSAEYARASDVKDFLEYAEKESVDLIQYIVNLKDDNGNTAMHYAISHGNFDIAHTILDTGRYDVNQMNSAGYTCAMLVALTTLTNIDDLAVAQRLFHMADVNIKAKNHGQTALMIAVSHGNIDMVQMLLEAQADVNVQDEDGSTALMCAAEHGRIDIVKLLLAQPDCDSTIHDIDNSTALKISVEAGYRDIGILLYAHDRVYGKKNAKR